MQSSSRLKTVYWLGVISLLPVALKSFIWLEVIRGVASNAIDGSGHYAAAHIYDREIFPDTFGWTNAYFAGMPLPNFYPPLFFWIVSFLHHTHLFAFASAFKLLVALPLLMMPLVFWFVGYRLSGKNQWIAFGAAIASATLYSVGEIFQPNTGLDISSTLLDGFYTQPMGFVLLLCWMLFYLNPRQNGRRFGVSALLLALTVLTNFFNAITAIVFIASVLLCDVVTWARSSDVSARAQLRKNFFLHLLSPWLALALSAFWLVPMLSSYEYLVTRPLIRPLGELITPLLWLWYFLAVTGALIWWRRQSGVLGPYLLACLILFSAAIFAGGFAPVWFPFQVFRFFSTINFLLSVPVGIALAYVTELYLQKRKPAPVGPKSSLVKQIIPVVYVVIVVVGVAFLMSSRKLTKASAFYSGETFPRISSVLEFARNRRDGLYLVEVVRPGTNGRGLVRSDSLALNAYLGAQGNETVSIVYREASPNSSFFNAELNAFSAYRENFGISSALLADLDFINQPFAQHIKRLQFMGVRYLVIGTTETKSYLSSEAEIVARHDIGDWTIFEIRPIAATTRTLQYRPALVVSDFTVKLRRRNQYDFIRLAEEQFNDAWFDVLLVRSPERKIDLLPQLEQFGALIIDTYDYQDELKAVDRLKTFSQNHTLILLSSEAPLFTRLRSEIPRAVVIERPREDPGDWITAIEPSEHYDGTSIRNTWNAIRSALDREKVASLERPTPVLIAQTFHPKWVRADNQPLYAATPFFTFGFFDQSPNIKYQRTRYDRWGLWCSAAALVFLGVLLAADLRR
ncbi:MAG TPA: hypothetical protein VFS90_11815 [Pyrinomonadaceae bacterium]|nr:hypothetical protein [Pyrinomonadaceae bacterium]